MKFNNRQMGGYTIGVAMASLDSDTSMACFRHEIKRKKIKTINLSRYAKAFLVMAIISAISISLLFPQAYYQEILTNNKDNVSTTIINGSNSQNNSGKKAPINPDFIQYQQQREILKASNKIPNSKDRATLLGFVPAPVDLSYLEVQQSVSIPEIRELVGYPSYYDLRDTGKVSSVKYQGIAGSCWAFATYSSIESYLLLNESWDFSENNMKNAHGFDIEHDEGGNEYMSAAYLARWSGPVNEADDPYNDISGVSPTGLSAQKHVQDILFIPTKANSTDNDKIKKAITDYGAVYSSMYWTAGNYNSTNHSYYYNSSATFSNHAISIVGWDDNFDRNKFSPVAPGNGAFIIKNSWGSWWGEDGYFYISYYDKFIGKKSAIFTAESLSSYDSIYQYDPLGWVSSFGYGDDTDWAANVFTARSNETITAIGFYTVQPNSQYLARIYMDPNSGPINTSTIAGSLSGTIEYPGYHTIRLNDSIKLAKGQKFSVVLRMTTTGYGYPLAIEEMIGGYSSNAISNASESYVSNTGTTWTDMKTLTSVDDANACIKAFTTFDNIAIAPASLNVTEGGSAATYSIALKQQPADNVLINIINGTRISANKTSVVFSPSNWSTPKYVGVSAIDDSIINGAANTFINHTISSNDTYFNGLRITNVSVIVADNDDPGDIQFNLSSFSINENAGNAIINVDRVNGAAGIVSVSYEISDLTATSALDFINSTSVLTFNDGEARRSFNVTIINDNVYEENETLRITLKSPINGSEIGTRSSMILTIINDDMKPSLCFEKGNVSVLENVTSFKVNLSLSEISNTQVSVIYRASNITALAGKDYASMNNTLIIDPGTTTASFNVTVIDDASYENNESFNVTLYNLIGNATLGQPYNFTVNILDDDEPVEANMTINLAEGWNIISVPFILNDNDIGTFFPADVKAHVSDVWAYNESVRGSWLYYSPSGYDPSIEHLTTIEPGKGYWVYIDNEASFMVNGTIMEDGLDSSIKFDGNWNLIGITGQEPYNVNSIFEWSTDVWTYDESVRGKWAYYSCNGYDPSIEHLTTIEPGKGYWVYKS
jgi:C1A family cysteine protease